MTGGILTLSCDKMGEIAHMRPRIRPGDELQSQAKPAQFIPAFSSGKRFLSDDPDFIQI